MPATGMAAAAASLKVKDLVRERRAINARIREDVFGWMDKKGYRYVPSETNFFLVDVGRPGREFARAMLKEKVAIGRTWSAMPNHVRVTVGTQDDMDKFKAAFEKVMAS
jgi:histidinol-phosphate/aromatic aminotransferase/cobyric acid decarboxylase-like protein